MWEMPFFSELWKQWWQCYRIPENGLVLQLGKWRQEGRGLGTSDTDWRRQKSQERVLKEKDVVFSKSPAYIREKSRRWTHTWMFVFSHIYVTSTRIHFGPCRYPHSHVYLYVHIFTLVHISTHICICPPTQIHIHTCVHLTLTHPHTSTHTPIHAFA